MAVSTLTSEMTRLDIDHEAFVRAPRDLVYARLLDVSSYPSWWTGFRMDHERMAGPTWDHEATTGPPRKPGGLEGRPPEPGETEFRFRLTDRRFWRRAVRLTARPYRFRPGKGLFYDLHGDLEGAAEWWLEEGSGGTVVHHLTKADVQRGGARTADTYRRAIRRGAWGLKDVVQSEVRDRIGLHP